MNIIQTMTDDDLYKFTMGQGVFLRYPKVSAEYRFINRGKQRFTGRFLAAFKQELAAMANIRISDQEVRFLKDTGYFLESYLDFLKSYRYNPAEVDANLSGDGNLAIRIRGPWVRTIYWEVKLLAIISELYFRLIDNNWTMAGQPQKAETKLKALRDNRVSFIDFGTRRRRSLGTQDLIVDTFSRCTERESFLGTSNVYLAMRHGLKAVGSTAHEWFQGISALENLYHANGEALRLWADIYGRTDIPLIALTDTFTTSAFLRDFTSELAEKYAGVRHDSGSPFTFIDRIVQHYHELSVSPAGKVVVFSDGLNVDRAVQIKSYAADMIKPVFGIGTHFSNDFERSPALNMVIKLFAVNDTPVVKLSDVPEKASGDREAVRIVTLIHTGRLPDLKQAA